MPAVGVVIVGASVAGLAAADALRAQGYDGPITIVDQQPHEPYDKPPLSKQLMTGAMDVDAIRLRPAGYFAASQLQMRLGVAARSLDADAREVRLDNEELLRYDGLIVATGARAYSPFPAAPAGVHVLRSLDDALAIRSALATRPRVVVIGGGLIGLELASVTAQLGCPVTVVEAFDTPLIRAIGRPAGQLVASLHAQHGVQVRCGQSVRRLAGTEVVEAVELDDGTILAADLVVVAVGARADAGWLESSGLDLDRGVLCDGWGATRMPFVFAGGDVARVASAAGHPSGGLSGEGGHWTTAVEQGRNAASALLAQLRGERLAPDPPQRVPYFWTDQFGVKLQFTGRHGPGSEAEIVTDGSHGRPVVLYHENGDLTGALVWGNPRLTALLRRAIESGDAISDVRASMIGQSSAPAQRGPGARRELAANQGEAQ